MTLKPENSSISLELFEHLNKYYQIFLQNICTTFGFRGRLPLHSLHLTVPEGERYRSLP